MDEITWIDSLDFRPRGQKHDREWRLWVLPERQPLHRAAWRYVMGPEAERREVPAVTDGPMALAVTCPCSVHKDVPSSLYGVSVELV